jgi:hypothetical protein
MSSRHHHLVHTAAYANPLSRQTWTSSRVLSVQFQAAHLDDYFILWDPARATKVYTPLPVINQMGHFMSIAKLDNIPSDPHPFKQFSKALAKTLTWLSGITDYSVVQVDNMTHYHTIYIMAFIWVSFTSNLTTLTMQLSLESLHFLLLESPSIHFPNLKALSLRLH